MFFRDLSSANARKRAVGTRNTPRNHLRSIAGVLARSSDPQIKKNSKISFSVLFCRRPAAAAALRAMSRTWPVLRSASKKITKSGENGIFALGILF